MEYTSSLEGGYIHKLESIASHAGYRRFHLSEIEDLEQYEKTKNAFNLLQTYEKGFVRVKETENEFKIAAYGIQGEKHFFFHDACEHEDNIPDTLVQKAKTPPKKGLPQFLYVFLGGLAGMESYFAIEKATQNPDPGGPMIFNPQAMLGLTLLGAITGFTVGACFNELIHKFSSDHARTGSVYGKNAIKSLLGELYPEEL